MSEYAERGSLVNIEAVGFLWGGENGRSEA